MLEKIINDHGYHNKIDVSYLLDYPSKNNEYLKVQKLKEIVANVIENPIEDEAADDSIPLQVITQKEAFIAAKTFYNFLL